MKTIFKTYIKKLLVTCLFLTLVSCSLTLLPEDSISPDTYFNSAINLRLWTNQFYSTFSGDETVTGLNADDLVDSNAQDVIQGTRSPESERG